MFLENQAKVQDLVGRLQEQNCYLELSLEKFKQKTQIQIKQDKKTR